MTNGDAPGPNPQREQVEFAIRRSHTSDEINRVLLYEWGLELDEIVNVEDGRIQIVSDLVGWTEREGKTAEFVAFLYRRRPGNPLLQKAAFALGIPAEAPAVQARPKSLEALVRRSRFISVEDFNAKSALVSRRLCKVEAPQKSGTGFLVAADLVLTAYHVIAEAAAAKAGIACIFDYHSEDSGERIESEAGWLRTSGAGARRSKSKDGELDFALVKLPRPVGAEGGEPHRGWFKLREALSVVSLRDLVLIAQHPKGRPQQYAWGEVTEYEPDSLRVSYDTSTESGSSGAPCMSTDLELFALHNSAGDFDNDGIPVRLIVDKLKKSRELRRELDV